MASIMRIGMFSLVFRNRQLLHDNYYYYERITHISQYLGYRGWKYQFNRFTAKCSRYRTLETWSGAFTSCNKIST